MSLPVDIGTWDVYRGDDWSLPIEEVDSNGDPIDLTTHGTTWTAQYRVRVDAADVGAFAVDASQAATGRIVLSLPDATTAALTSSTYVFDVQVTGGAVSPHTLYRGRLHVTKDVTHA